MVPVVQERHLVGKVRDYRLLLEVKEEDEGYRYTLLVEPLSWSKNRWLKAVGGGKKPSVPYRLLSLVLPEEVPWLLEGWRQFAALLPKTLTLSLLLGQGGYNTYFFPVSLYQEEVFHERFSLFLHPPAKRALTALERLCLLLLGAELFTFTRESFTLERDFLLEAIDWTFPLLARLPEVIPLLSTSSSPLFLPAYTQSFELAPRITNGFLRPLFLQGELRKLTQEEEDFIHLFSESTYVLPLYLLGTPSTQRASASLLNAFFLARLPLLQRLPPPPPAAYHPFSLFPWWQSVSSCLRDDYTPSFIPLEQVPWYPSASTEDSLGEELLSLPLRSLPPAVEQLSTFFSSTRDHRLTVPPALCVTAALQLQPSCEEVIEVVEKFHPLTVAGRGKIATVLTSSGFRWYSYHLLQELLPYRAELSPQEVTLLLLHLPKEVTIDYLTVLFPQEEAQKLLFALLVEEREMASPVPPLEEDVLLPLLQEHYGPLATARFLLAWPLGEVPLTYAEVQGLIALDDESYLTLPPSWWRRLITVEG